MKREIEATRRSPIKSQMTSDWIATDEYSLSLQRRATEITMKTVMPRMMLVHFQHF